MLFQNSRNSLNHHQNPKDKTTTYIQSMTSDVQNGLIKWSSSPRDYQWKGTISINTNTWSVLAHCKPLKSDVFIKIKQLATNDSNTDLDAFAATINNLINLHHSNLLTPVHSFHAKNDIWIIYPLSSGGYTSIIHA